METQTETQLQANASELVRHVRRPSWGVGVEVWERNGKRAYQFSDGKMRVIKEGFFHLLEPTQSPGDGCAVKKQLLSKNNPSTIGDSHQWLAS